MSQKKLQQAADLLFQADLSKTPCAPVRELIGLDIEAAYSVQKLNVERKTSRGHRAVGRKIGLTSLSAQQQLGINQPDFGYLFDDMESGSGQPFAASTLIQPKAEAEIALMLNRDLASESITLSDLISAVEWVAPSIEIVDSRVANWDIKISDTIADNASSARYILGGPVLPLHGIDLENAPMVMKRNGLPVSFGAGMACLGNPLNAALWLAQTSYQLGDPLAAGEIVLTGALGPMCDVAPGDVFEATIGGVGTVVAHCANN